MKLKTRIYDIIEKATPGDLSSRIFDISIMTLILANVIAVILETVDSIATHMMPFFKIFEIISVIIFTIEYLFRLWSCTVDNKFSSSIKGRIRFALTPMALIDLFAILPFYLPMLIPFDLRFIRVLRLIRMFRIFKIGRYSESMKILGKVLKAKKEELCMTFFAQDWGQISTFYIR